MCRICADIEKSMRKIGFLPPEIGSHNIVQGKTYDTAEPNGLFLYEQIEDKLRLQTFKQSVINEDLPLNRYRKEQIIKPRIGQGAFKILITDAYHRRCALREKKHYRF